MSMQGIDDQHNAGRGRARELQRQRHHELWFRVVLAGAWLALVTRLIVVVTLVACVVRGQFAEPALAGLAALVLIRRKGRQPPASDQVTR
jgi:hypothetical protein